MCTACTAWDLCAAATTTPSAAALGRLLQASTGAMTRRPALTREERWAWMRALGPTQIARPGLHSARSRAGATADRAAPFPVGPGSTTPAMAPTSTPWRRTAAWRLQVRRSLLLPSRTSDCSPWLARPQALCFSPAALLQRWCLCTQLLCPNTVMLPVHADRWRRSWPALLAVLPHHPARSGGVPALGRDRALRHL